MKAVVSKQGNATIYLATSINICVSYFQITQSVNIVPLQSFKFFLFSVLSLLT